MRIIKEYELKDGDVIDFTSLKCAYWNKKKPENKIQLMTCPICQRIGMPINDFEGYVHKSRCVLAISSQREYISSDDFDACMYSIEISKEVQDIRRRLVIDLPINQNDFSNEALNVAKLRGWKF